MQQIDTAAEEKKEQAAAPATETSGFTYSGFLPPIERRKQSIFYVSPHTSDEESEDVNTSASNQVKMIVMSPTKRGLANTQSLSDSESDDDNQILKEEKPKKRLFTD